MDVDFDIELIYSGKLVILRMLMTLHGVIVAVAIPVIEAISVSLLMSALRKRSRILPCYELLLRTNHE